MVNAVFLQVAMTLAVVVAAALVGGRHAALSAGLGGSACFVPSALFALRLAVETRRPGGASVNGFFIGEFAKIAATIGLLFIVATTYRDVVWLALVIGFIAALKSYFLMFLFGARYR